MVAAIGSETDRELTTDQANPEGLEQIMEGLKGFSTRAYGTPLVWSDKRGRNWDIYVSSPGSDKKTWLTNDPARDFMPKLSRDGSKIAYMSQRGGDDEVFVMNTDGTKKMNVSNSPSQDMCPDISPDGTKVLFTSSRYGTDELYIVNADGTGLAQLTDNGGVDSMASFSPDGTKIVFVSQRDGNREIYIMNVDGTAQTNLTKSPDREDSLSHVFEDGATSSQAPLFTLDGSRIVFMSGGDGKQYIMKLDGSEMTDLKEARSKYFEKAFRAQGQLKKKD